MDQTAAPSPQAALIAAARAFAAGLAGDLKHALTAEAWRTRRGLRRLLAAFLVPAEAAMRRAVHLLADTLAPEAESPASRPAPARRKAPTQKTAAPRPTLPRAPVFRLTEPPPRPALRARPFLPEHLRPRISIAGFAPPPPPPEPAPARPAPDAAAYAARLLRRLAALEGVLENPERAARRLLRRRAREASPRPKLALLAIPGHASPAIGAEGRACLEGLNRAVLQAAIHRVTQPAADTS